MGDRVLAEVPATVGRVGSTGEWLPRPGSLGDLAGVEPYLEVHADVAWRETALQSMARRVR